MCIIVLGQRRCAMCAGIMSDNIKLPADSRYRQCELAGKKHKHHTIVNYVPFVCACCKESARVRLARKKEGMGQSTFNPEVEEFVPENEKAGQKIAWVGGWWVEQ